MGMICEFLPVSEVEIQNLRNDPAGVEVESPTTQSFIFGGGDLLSYVEVGYGPPRLFGVEKTAAIADFVASITLASLRAKFIATNFVPLDIYPGAGLWSEENIFDDYLAAYFLGLQEFLQNTRRNNAGMLVWLG